MTTIWPLPKIEINDLISINEQRPVALLTGDRSWAAVSPLLNLPLVVQAEPYRVEVDYLDSLAEGLPPQVQVVYGVGGGMIADAAKYIGWKKGLPTVIVPTALSQDGFFTALVANRADGSVSYITTGPVEKLIIDWEVIRAAPQNVRGAAIVELLTIVTGILDWKYAAERNKNTPDTRFVPWAAGLMAGIAQQAFKIAAGVGRGNVEALRNLLDLICMEVQLTNQMGHNRPQEGSEQYFAYAIEQRVRAGSPPALCGYGWPRHFDRGGAARAGYWPDPHDARIGGYPAGSTAAGRHRGHPQDSAGICAETRSALQHPE